jgi:hypothetical protein
MRSNRLSHPDILVSVSHVTTQLIVHPTHGKGIRMTLAALDHEPNVVLLRYIWFNLFVWSSWYW